ncbi:MAG: aspartate--ammonia ligase [Clostridia bacterium]|nr:aspartate--ammonia ligase [Clostridia bacterium]
MSTTYVPKNYTPALDVYDTQKAISFIKHTFQEKLADALNLKRVSAPLFVEEGSGLNDNLNGHETPVSFDVPAVNGVRCEVVHSLAKWKRMALKEYRFYVGNGLYTDMNAIRREEELDNIHSIYVDQWDWEKIITRKERTLDYLKSVAATVVDVIYQTNELLKKQFPQLSVNIERELSAITTHELEEMYPTLAPDERETAYVKEHKTALIMQIGGNLKNGKPHGGRAPDYDDWELNGDIIFYNEVLDRAFEISSMGIRVDEKSLMRQLEASGKADRLNLPFHKKLMSGELPLTVGGGIGQSRLCMLMMGCAHIGEVQCSIWSDEIKKECEAAGIRLL